MSGKKDYMGDAAEAAPRGYEMRNHDTPALDSAALPDQPAATMTASGGTGTLTNLVGLSREELTAAMTEIGQPAFRARQLWNWIYHRGETDFAKMSNRSNDFRAALSERFVVQRPDITVDRKSIDGTRKWLLKFPDGQEVESVHIPESDRGTLCVSSQVGCTLTCKFCHTGTQKLVRNLTPAEIVGQVMNARDKLGEWPTP